MALTRLTSEEQVTLPSEIFLGSHLEEVEEARAAGMPLEYTYPHPKGFSL